MIAKAVEVVFGIDLPLGAEIASALIGAAPDLIGEAERIIKHDRTLWNWYNAVHIGRTTPSPPFEGRAGEGSRTWWWYLRFIPQWGKHILKDRFTHTSMGAKRNWYPPGEMWKEHFWGAIAYCWPNWLGWAESVAVHAIVLGVAGWLA